MQCLYRRGQVGRLLERRHCRPWQAARLQEVHVMWVLHQGSGCVFEYWTKSRATELLHQGKGQSACLNKYCTIGRSACLSTAPNVRVRVCEYCPKSQSACLSTVLRVIVRVSTAPRCITSHITAHGCDYWIKSLYAVRVWILHRRSVLSTGVSTPPRVSTGLSTAPRVSTHYGAEHRTKGQYGSEYYTNGQYGSEYCTTG